MATGTVTIDLEKCKGCDLCIDACPQEILTPADTLNSRGYRPVILHDPDFACTGCALCATVCPDACFTVYRTIFPGNKGAKRRPPTSITAVSAEVAPREVIIYD